MSDWDAKVSRIDQPAPGLLSLTLRARGRTQVLVVAYLPGTLEMGVVDARPRGAAATEPIRQLRRHLEGGRLVRVRRSRRVARLDTTRAGEHRALFVAPTKPNGAWWLTDEVGDVTIIHSPGAPKRWPSDEEHLVDLGPSALRESSNRTLQAHDEARKNQHLRLLRRDLKRLRRKRDAVAADLARAGAAEDLNEQVGLLLANATTIPADARVWVATRWSDPTKTVAIELDPAKTPAQVADDLFSKSKRLKRGLAVVPERLAAVERELAQRLALLEQADEMTAAELASALAEHDIVPKLQADRTPATRRATARLPYRTFVSRDGVRVLVGRGAADNDKLTLKTARPHDLWLHARGVTGAHVVVPLARGQACAPGTLADAAMLAAHFSDHRGERVVDVLYTPRRFVRKRKGSPIGSVTLEREKVIAVRVETERLQQLLRSERKIS